MRGRNRNKGPNPLTRTYESNGPDVKIRGTAQHVADKYAQLARDSHASGDPVAAENYFQHAEHYYRLIATAQEQLRQQFGYQQRPFDDDGEEGDEEGPGFGFGQGGRGAQSGDDDMGTQPQPYDPPPEGERQQRFERGERPERGERFDRNDRPERRERFQRPDRPPRQELQTRQEPQNGDGRQDRSEFRRPARREEVADQGVNGLPAFLTNPVRAPIAIEEGPEPAGAEAGASDEAGGEMGGRFGRRRRRRSRSFEGGESPEASADFAPEGTDPRPVD